MPDLQLHSMTDVELVKLGAASSALSMASAEPDIEDLAELAGVVYRQICAELSKRGVVDVSTIASEQGSEQIIAAGGELIELLQAVSHANRQ
jgi:hypothetical protein